MAALCSAQQVNASGRADEILEKLAAGFRALGAYGVAFEVTADDNAVRGRYSVEGDRYYIVLGDAEVYSDGAVRYEVDNRRREVTLDVVDLTSRNILSNPARAFDFIGSEYAASLLGEQGGKAVVRLVPTSKNVSPAGEVTVTVDTASMRPSSLRYDYDGERIDIAVLSVAPLDAPLKVFDRANYAEYEFIDFR